MIDIHGSELSKGRLYTMGARSIETGMYFEIDDTPYLSNGKLLNIKTTSSHTPTNPIYIGFHNMDDGKGP